MLSVKERQIKLAFLGYYKGNIDGINGPLTKESVLNLQKDYFVNNNFRHDIDGIYGKNTDKLLCSLYNVKTTCKHFKLTEFKCRCKNKYCSGYPDYLNIHLLENLEKLREYLGTPIIGTSGFRCNKWNSIQSTSKNSRHKYGKAFDFYFKGGNNLEKRKEVTNKWISYKNSRYSYSNGYFKNRDGSNGVKTAKYMGSAIHVDVL